MEFYDIPFDKSGFRKKTNEIIKELKKIDDPKIPAIIADLEELKGKDKNV